MPLVDLYLESFNFGSFDRKVQLGKELKTDPTNGPLVSLMLCLAQEGSQAHSSELALECAVLCQVLQKLIQEFRNLDWKVHGVVVLPFKKKKKKKKESMELFNTIKRRRVNVACLQDIKIGWG